MTLTEQTRTPNDDANLEDMTAERRAKLIELHEDFGFRLKTVVKWQEERITTVLAARRRDAKLALARADGKAKAIDGARGQPSKLERVVAAAYLEESLAKGGDECVNAVLYVGHALTDDEAKLLAAELITMFRADGWGRGAEDDTAE